MDFERTIQPVVERVSKGFPVLLLTGMRQIGKSWAMEHLGGKDRRYITLDDVKMRTLAKTGPERFQALPAVSQSDEKNSGSQTADVAAGIRQNMAGFVSQNYRKPECQK